MATPESKIKTLVKQELKRIGAYQHWPVQMGMGMPTLDCIGCYKGWYFAIETKAPGKKPTKRQLLTMEQIRAASGIVFVIDNEKDATGLGGALEWYADVHCE